MCREKETLLKKAHELKRKLLLCQRKRELVDVLNPQVSGGHGLQAACPKWVIVMFGGIIYRGCHSLPGSKSVLGFRHDRVLVCDS